MRIIQKVLSNGLKVILVPRKSAKSFTALFVVKAGWKYEIEKELQGISHFLEHMAFKGTVKRPTALEISTAIESKGAIGNAATSEEAVVYFIKSSSRFKEMSYDLLSDMVLHPLFDQAEIDKEVGTIIEEMRFRESNPSIFVEDLWPKLLYGDQPAGRNGVGTPATVSHFQRSHFFDYHRQLYTSPNSAFIVVGKLEAITQEMEMIGRHFQDLNVHPPIRVRLPVLEQQAVPSFLLAPKEIEQTWVCLGVRAYPSHHPDKYAVQLLSIILGGGMSSRLFAEIREKRGLAYAVHSGMDVQSDVGSVFTHAGLNCQKVKEAISIILDEYKRMAVEKVSNEELQKVKDLSRGRTELALEDSVAIAGGIANQFVLSGKIRDPQKEMEKYEQVTPEDIMRVARDIFTNEKLNLTIVGPHAKDEESIRNILKF